MRIVIAFAGIVIVVGLAVAVGLLDGRARREAWGRVAVARRVLHEERIELERRHGVLALQQRRLDDRERLLDLLEQLDLDELAEHDQDGDDDSHPDPSWP